MNNAGANYEAGLQYPGQYRPPFYIKDNSIGDSTDIDSIDPLASAQIIELPDHYEVEVNAPGHRHDDFIVTTEGNTLHITALGDNAVDIDTHAISAKRSVFFDVMLTLPGNVDSDFIRAEYRSGILNIWFRKAETAVLNLLHSIVVY